MKLRSPIFASLAAYYEDSQAGRTGHGTRDVQIGFEELCQRAGIAEGEPYELAVNELRSVDGRLVKLEWDHPRARTTIHKVRLAPREEAVFFATLNRESPTQRRQRWQELFTEAAGWTVPTDYAAEWQNFCTARAARSEHWDQMEPFRVRQLREGRQLLETTARLLTWHGENLIRWVSSHLCGHSKTLETARKSRETLLREASGGRIESFESHGILPMPQEARISGPVVLEINGHPVDCSVQEVTTLSLADLVRARLLDCRATRCLTVENKTVFLDLARKRSGELLVWTSFPSAATLTLLALLPATLEFHHFGDTDPSGFHILHDLSARTQRPVHPFRMEIRPSESKRPLTPPERDLLTKLLDSPHLPDSSAALQTLLQEGVGVFEQEEFQPAPLARWPFYEEL